jgi:hypothetical protein
MRARGYVIAAALVAGLSGTATAQTTTTTTTTTNQPATVSTRPVNAGETRSHWTAAGFVGSNFGATADDPSIDYGGQIGWLWHGIIGGEAIGDFAPKFRVDNALLAENPHVNSYMANLILALPLGSQGQFQPYASGGIGAIHVSSKVFQLLQPTQLPAQSDLGVNPISDNPTETASQARFGSDFGGGVMGFVGNFGFRGDVRYYKATTNNNVNETGITDVVTANLLSGLDFWRANLGLAFRW